MPLSVQAMLELVLTTVPRCGESEKVPTSQALGRVLADRAVAPVDLPAFPRSAVDGYALSVADCQGATPEQPVFLPLGAKVLAGQLPAPLGPGGATFVTTGAMLPPGADAVILVERAQVQGNALAVSEPPRPGQHLSRPGEDIRRGRFLFPAGRRLGLPEIAILASLGYGELEVIRRPRVAIFSTGDELVSPGAPLAPAQVHDTNSVILRAAVEAAGGVVTRWGILPDRYPELAEIAAACAGGESDLVVTTGGTGASMLALAGSPVDGLHDLVPGLLAGSGVILNQGVGVVPGKPTAFGRIGPTPVFALAGWPYAVLVTFHLFVAPCLARLGGLPLPAERRLGRFPLGEEVKGEAGFRRYVQVRLEDRGGERFAVPILPPPPPSAARSISLLLEADGYIYLEAGETDRSAGEPVDVYVFPGG